MMAQSLDQQPPQEEGKKYKSSDVELSVRLGVKLLKEGGGLEIIGKALNESQDPAQVIAQFLTQLIGKLAEQLQTEYDIDPGIFLAKNGWLDAILDYIEVQLKLPKEFSDQVYGEVLETIKAAAMAPPPPNDAMGGDRVVMEPNQEQQEQQAQAPPPPVDPQQPQGGMV